MQPYVVSYRKTHKIKAWAKPDLMLLAALPIFWPATIKHCGTFRSGNSDSNEKINMKCNGFICEKILLCLPNVG